MKTLISVIAVLMLATGCATNKHYVVAATSTIIGLEVAQNQASQMYQAKLGYNRAELALVPSNRASGVAGEAGAGSGAKDTTSVVMELHYANIFSLSSSGIYQRLAVGDAANQPSAAFMFAKDAKGVLDPVVASQVAASIKSIPAQTPVLLSIKLPLAKAFEAATDKLKFEAAAKANGYASFSDFLIEINTAAEKVSAVARSIQEAK